MDQTQETKQTIELIAGDTLALFKKVAASAQAALHAPNASGPNSLATVNTFTSGSVIQKLGRISQENRASYKILVHEPAIARVVVVDTEGSKRTYFICRTTPISGIPNFASYHAPAGRLAALPVGEAFSFPNGDRVEVLERALLHPSLVDQEWDSRDTIVEGDHFGPFTIESFRSLLQKVAGTDLTEDLLDKLLAEESQAANIIEGIRRSVITKMGLRDQPILDQYQDEIFRLPLDMRLLILGPPGTGKTTTLIRRLGQKLDTAFLDEDERGIVESVATSNGGAHANSWLMFTPTELLKQYLKEAFAREGVPASDQRIRTWSDCRRELSKNTFSILRTVNSGGSFILKDSTDHLTADASANSIDWFTDFDEWQKSAFIIEVRAAAQVLSENKESAIATIGQRLQLILQRESGGALSSMFSSLAAEVVGVQTIVADIKDLTDNKIRKVLNLQLKTNNAFIDELAKFLDGLQQLPDAENDDFDDQDDDDEEVNIPRTGRAAAASVYMKAVRAQARAHARKRSLGKNTRNGKIIQWLGERTLSEDEYAEVGAILLVQASARRFVNPLKRYIDGIPKRYKVFRRTRQETDKWYRKGGLSSSTDLHPLELDVVLLTILRDANGLLAKMNILRDIDAPVWSSLKPILDLYKNQILVDEVTDFSPVQIACMAALSHPRIRSFFACGDFNQRLTTWGSRSLDEMKWVLPELEIKEITVSYRQSRQLNELACAIIQSTGGTDRGVSLPINVNSDGVAPALMENVSEYNDVVGWLAKRICEIERFVGQLPSIAVFVVSETEVQPVADALNVALASENTQVVACTKGQIMGQDNEVRVFDVQHIKGLEFEAVFFIGIDRLAILHPQLFDKYLYVGTTRAATYLGVTCDDMLPASISTLRPMFVSDWKTP